MSESKRAVLFAIVLGLVLAPSTWAQTNDHIFRSWRWSADAGAPRAFGLAGAYVAVADDATAPLYNPAAMTTLTRNEVAGSALHQLDGIAGLDSLGSVTSLGYAGGAGLLSPKWAIGGYLSQPQAVNLTLAETSLPDGSADGGWLRARVTEWGAALAWQPLAGLHVGARVAGAHFGLESDYNRQVSGDTILRVGSASGDTRITGSLGVLLTPGRSVRLGLLVTPGVSFLVDRTAVAPQQRTVLDEGSEFEVRLPSTVVAGMSVDISPKLRLVGQVDYVRYSEILSTLQLREGTYTDDDYELADAWEPRLALEASFPIGDVSLQLRGGAHLVGEGSVRFVGFDDVEAAAFAGGAERWRGTGGLSLVGRSWSLHFGLAFTGQADAATGGLAIRF